MSRPVVTLLVAGGIVLLASCRFERRPEPDNGHAGVADTSAALARGALGDSLRSLVAAYHEALRVGDAARVATLSVPGATVVDQEEGVHWRMGSGTDAGGRLPGPLSAATVGLGWERAGSDLAAWEASALLVDRYTATVSGESVPWFAVETFVFERGPEGWLIRHVHRSRGGPADSARRDRRPFPEGEASASETAREEGPHLP